MNKNLKKGSGVKSEISPADGKTMLPAVFIQKIMEKFKPVEPGVIALIQQTKDGRIAQIGITQAQSNMLQFFLAKLSEDSKLVKMPEEYDLVLKSSVCKRCQKKWQITLRLT